MPAQISRAQTEHGGRSYTTYPYDSILAAYQERNGERMGTSIKNDNDDDDDKKLFFTTSDLMETLNASIQAEQKGSTSSSSTTPTTTTPSCGFELQRRLPDGSTRKASPREMEMANLQSKLQQVAAEIHDLPTYQHKLQWANLQRQEGNRMYKKGHYKEAIDVYLTCFIIKPTTTRKNENDKNEVLLFQKQVWWPVLNNLAQCTLKLGMYSRTEIFCNMAFKEEEEDSENDEVFIRYISKLYFRRGKARRFLGKYKEARKDLQQARYKILLRLDSKEEEEGSSDDNNNTTKELLNLVDKELQQVDKSEKEGKRNQQRQERAMQQLWNTNNTTTTEQMKDRTQDGASIVKSKKSSSSSLLYTDESIATTTTTRRRRNYSTLRAKRNNGDDDEYNSDDDDESLHCHQQSSSSSYYCWRYYLSMVGRVAEALLIMTGGSLDDDDDDDNHYEKQR